jgi:phosphoribosylformylglycinamidine synthase
VTEQVWLIEAEIMPKRGVNDPQGDAIRGALGALGFTGVEQVRCGKLIRVRVLAHSAEEARVEGLAMCDKLLANPVIEQYSLAVSAAGEDSEA